MPAGEAAGVQRGADGAVGKAGPWRKRGRGESGAPSRSARRRPLALGLLLVSLVAQAVVEATEEPAVVLGGQAS